MADTEADKKKATEIVRKWVIYDNVGILELGEAATRLITSVADALSTVRAEQREIDAKIAEAESERFTGFASLGTGGVIGIQTVNNIVTLIRGAGNE